MFADYASSIAALGAVATLLLLQLIAADVLGIARRHTPGTSVSEDHGDPLFRVSRALANANESVAIFVCGLLFCVLGGASPAYTAAAAWSYFGCRLLYAACYYANLQIPRSAVFGLSLLSLAALLLVGAFG